MIKGRPAVAEALDYCGTRVKLYEEKLRSYEGAVRPAAEDEDALVRLALRLIDDVGCGRPEALFLALHTVSEHLKEF